MKSTLRLSTKQQIALSPQIRQNIRMLQLAAKELTEEIDETIANSPLLQEKRIYQTHSGGEDYSVWLENQAAPNQQTLEDHLISQLGYLNLDTQMYVIACIVISQLDDDGYLRRSSDDLIQVCTDEDIKTDHQQIRQAIKIVQQLSPSGIACTNLAECLSKQVLKQNTNQPLKTTSLKIIENLQLLAKDKHQVFQRLNVHQQLFTDALDLIQQLDPAPGKAFNQEKTVYVQADILVSVVDKQLKISLNPSINRGIELNQQYIDLLKSSNNTDDRDYLKKNLDQAKWWLNALVQRNKTLLKVTEFMVTHQLKYVENGDLSELRPLKQQQIADAVGVHVSTVSRAIRQKYLQTPTGMVLLKQLLANSIITDNESSLSNQAVKSIIRNLIKNEPSQTPLSDSKIVAELKTRGITIARRTVNKYREQLNIPASNRRKVS